MTLQHYRTQEGYYLGYYDGDCPVDTAIVVASRPTNTCALWRDEDWDYSIPNAENARNERNMLIAQTDVWALSDRTMSAEQTAYRQALRDITAQSGFPTDITWPTKPEEV
jgi:hypothetical protein